MSALDTEGIDWEGLRRLRAGFLDGTAGESAYWTSAPLLESYDRTFGERIGWKWDYVLDELERRSWAPPDGPVVDWACGSGVAGRRFLGRFGGSGPLVCSDRSSRAVDYARMRAAREGFEVGEGMQPSTLLISHVLGEIDDRVLASLIGLARSSTAVVWVEPGDRRNARSLMAVRDDLLPDLGAVAPCTHQNACPLLDPSMEGHWCHHFAPPPPDVFTDPGWGRFSSEIGIDLRSTPVSFLVMDRRPVAPPGTDAVHTIGRPRVSKPDARVFGCDAWGAREARITKRRMPESYRQARKGRLPTLARWTVEDGEVLQWDEWD